MKRAFPQKVKPVFSDTVRNEEDLPKASTYRVGLFKQVLPEGNRRARTSAAMIGLAISMGASSLFLPRQGDGAMAAEPKAASPNAPTALASPENGAIESSGSVETAPADISTPMPSVIQHKSVQEEPTQWPVSQTEQVNATAIASDNGISSQPVLQSETELNGLSYSSVPALEAMAPWKESLQNEAIEAAPSTRLAPFTSPVAHSARDISLTDNVNRLFEAKQEALAAKHEVAGIKKIKPLSNRFKNGLAEFGSEESASSYQSVTEPAQSSTSVANPSPNIGNLSAGAAPEELQTPVVESPTIAVPNWAKSPVTSPTRLGAIAPESGEAPTLAPLSLPAPEASTLSPSGGPVRAGISLESGEIPVLAPLSLPAPEASTPSPLNGPVRAGISPESVEAPALAPVGLPTPEATAPNAVEESVAPTETAETVVTPDLSQAVVINPEANQAATAKIYRVNPGDTLGAIAQNYGITSTDLIKANRLNDPNFININQTLQIPLYQPGRQEVQTTALIHPKLSGTVATSEQLVKQSKPEMPLPNLVLPQPTLTASTPTLSLVSPATSDSNSSVSISLASETNESTERAEEPLRYTPSTANLPASLHSPAIQPETEYNSSVEGLRAEIHKLREKYRTQKASTEAGNAIVGTVAEIAPPTISSANTASNLSVQAKPINPEFSPNKYAQTGQIEVQNLQPQQVEQLRSQAMSSEQALDQSGANQSVMATAPLGSDNYEPLQPRMVSPELPPLASPDTYLPKGSATFTGFIWPAQGEMTSGYGWRWGRMHKGIDIAAAIGTPVVAAAPGKITYAEWNEGGYGNLVEITHPDGSTTLYGHNDRILVREGQEVEQGQQIAEMGSTGFSTGPHCHFEIHPPGQGAVNPIAYLPQSGGVSSDQ